MRGKWMCIASKVKTYLDMYLPKPHNPYQPQDHTYTHTLVNHNSEHINNQKLHS